MSLAASSQRASLIFFYILLLIGLVAAHNGTHPETNGTTIKPTSTPTPSGEFPVSGANSLSSTAALFGAILAAVMFSI